MAPQVPKFNSTILVSPLDWGLGHATRCMPIIRLLVQKGCRVIVAASGFHQILLQNEFPGLLFLSLDGYGIRYGKKNVVLTLAQQLPGFFKTIKKEKAWLEKAIEGYCIDAVVSDNRYGLHSAKVPCIFITHQLQLKMPPFFGWMEGFIQRRLYGMVNDFTGCWIPDVEPIADSLAGTLSHPKVLPKMPVSYIGWLSRFDDRHALPHKYRLTICLSGPEPQRTLLEEIILPQLNEIEGSVLLIRGLPGQTTVPQVPPHVNVANHLPTKEMETAFLESGTILSRSGYSTLMDMQVLGCQCIYIPTPGQTEQEFLGKRMAGQKMAVVKKQAGFHLLSALQEAESQAFASRKNYSNQDLETVIDQWLSTIKK